jgi:hypothetical protein
MTLPAASADLPAWLDRLAVHVVVHAGGPFQGEDFRVTLRCSAIGQPVPCEGGAPRAGRLRSRRATRLHPARGPASACWAWTSDHARPPTCGSIEARDVEAGRGGDADGTCMDSVQV